MAWGRLGLPDRVRFLLAVLVFLGPGLVTAKQRRLEKRVVLFLITTGVTIWMYWDVFSSASIPLILLAIPGAVINGFCEEALWRGLYIKVFPKDWLSGLLFPSIGFALWHIAPQLVFPSEGGIFPFVLSTLFLGLSYGWIAYRTESARWTAISHSLSAVIAVGGYFPLVLYRLFGWW